MKNYPLALQIWTVIALITLCISVMLAFILPRTLKDFFTQEIYATIDSAQDLVVNQFNSSIYRDFIGPDFFGKQDQVLKDIRTVRHIIMFEDGRPIVSFSVPSEFIKEIRENAYKQREISKNYTGEVAGEKIFYTITEGIFLNKRAYLVSYMTDSYRDDLVKTLFKKLTTITSLVFVLSWIPAILLSRYISRPLVDLEGKVESLALKKWDSPITTERQDEIGRLSHSIEELRQELIRQDEAEQSFLQNISHELKTPVMVIRSFTNAISDGIYPSGTLEGSIDIIDEEAERLERRIGNLLYLTKLDYLYNHDFNKLSLSLDKLLKDTVKRLSWARTDINWKLDLIEANILGDKDQWQVVFENIIDNQIRYAKDTIEISFSKKDNLYQLKFWNNGDGIEEDVMKNMFTKYNKGYGGETGLGLTIVQRILKLHQGEIKALNENDGVSFYIYIREEIKDEDKLYLP